MIGVIAVDEGTLQFYRSNARSYADWAKAPSTRLRGFLALLPSGGSILELGCGAGNHSAVMLAEGFSVRATDGSPEMAEIASQRLGHAVEAMRFDQLDAHEAYDGVWASACLLHVPRDELTGILARIHRALRPSGVFYASYKMGEGDGRDSLGRYYNYASPEWLEATYASAGPWITLSSDRNVIQSFDETPANMLHLVVRKA
nr:class I SAM-dependent methyltransferase [Bradyrhizobium sp. 44]